MAALLSKNRIRSGMAALQSGLNIALCLHKPRPAAKPTLVRGVHGSHARFMNRNSRNVILQFFGKTHSAETKTDNVLLLAGGICAALATGILIGVFDGVPVLLGLSLLLFMAFGMSDYKAGVLLAIVLLPLTAVQQIPREIFGIKGLNPLNATLAMSAISFVIAQITEPGRIAIPKFPRYFWAYIGVVAFAGFHGARQFNAHLSSIPAYYLVLFDTAAGYLREILLKPMIIVATAMLVAVAVANTQHAKRYLIPLFCAALTLPLMAIGYLAISGAPLSSLASSESRGFLSVLGIHANELGLFSNIGFALALFCFFSVPGLSARCLLGLIIVILATAVMLTFSRGAYLGFLAAIGYFLFTQKRAGLMLLALSLAVAAAFLMPEAVVERATTGMAGMNVADMSAGRVDKIWRPLLPEVFSSPVIGHGLGSIAWSEAARHREILMVGHPHSAYLGLLLDFGVSGAIVVSLFFLHMWRLFKHIAQHHPDPLWRGFFNGAKGAILLLLVQGLTDDRFTPTLPQTLLWLSYGMAIGLVARLNKEVPDNALSRAENA
jgi:O-antigen ligase